MTRWNLSDHSRAVRQVKSVKQLHWRLNWAEVMLPVLWCHRIRLMLPRAVYILTSKHIKNAPGDSEKSELSLCFRVCVVSKIINHLLRTQLIANFILLFSPICMNRMLKKKTGELYNQNLKRWQLRVNTLVESSSRSWRLQSARSVG